MTSALLTFAALLLLAHLLPVLHHASAQAIDGRNAFRRDNALLNGALTLQERIDRRGCNVSVCYALDGSASLGLAEFSRIKEFVQVVALIVDTDEEARNGAIQFGLSNSLVSNLTTNATQFVQEVALTLFDAAPRTFTAAGVNGCSVQLRGTSSGSRIVTVVLSDGQTNFGVDATRLTQSFVEDIPSADVLSVAVGDADFAELQSVSTNRSSVIDLRSEEQLSNATKRTVEFICQL